MDDALEVADIMDGQLPHWQRQERTGDAEEAGGSQKLPRLTINKLQISDIDDKSSDDE